MIKNDPVCTLFVYSCIIYFIKLFLSWKVSCVAWVPVFKSHSWAWPTRRRMEAEWLSCPSHVKVLATPISDVTQGPYWLQVQQNTTPRGSGGGAGRWSPEGRRFDPRLLLLWGWRCLWDASPWGADQLAVTLIGFWSANIQRYYTGQQLIAQLSVIDACWQLNAAE